MKNFLKSKLHRGLFFALCATFLCCAIFAFTNIFVINKSAKADATATAGSADVVSYRISGTCAQMEQQWVAAVQRSIDSKSQVKIILGNDWTATANATYTTAFGTTASYFDGGQIIINTGMNIIVDLNGHAINRDMIDKEGHNTSRVMAVLGGKLTIEDSSEAKNGAITGGNIDHGNSEDSIDGLGGGIAINNDDAVVTLNSGNITNNRSRVFGGVLGVNRVLFIMNGVFISKNSSGLGAGIQNYGTIELNGGVISENESDGVYCDNGSTAILNGGSIINNGGHGIRMFKADNITLKAGTIANNSGWGMYMATPPCTVNLEGGSITNNKLGGLWCLGPCTINISGSPKVYNNVNATNNTARNIQYNTAPTAANGLILNVTGKLNPGTYLGITGFLTNGVPNTTFNITSGYSANGNAAADVTRYFFSDVTGYKPVATATSGTFEVKLTNGSDSTSFASAWITAVNNNSTFKMTANWVAVANTNFGTFLKF